MPGFVEQVAFYLTAETQFVIGFFSNGGVKVPDALFIFGEIALITLCGYYAIEGIQRLWKPKVRVPSQEWRETVEPIVKKCRLASKLHMGTTFNADGSSALAGVLEKMADELDRRS